MTTYIPDTNVTTSSRAFLLASGDRIYVGEGIQVASTDATAIVGAPSPNVGNLINIDGTVVGVTGVGLGMNSTLTIGQTGRISGFELGVSNNDFNNLGSVIYNDGAIYGGTLGVYTVFGGFAELHNSGLIVSGLGTRNTTDGILNAAICNMSGTALYTENSGLVQARKAGSFAFLSGVAAETILNTGQMIGAIKFGGNNDSYNGAAGRLAGRLFGDEGSDTAIGGIDNDWFEGGADSDILRGNGGNDRLDGGTGADQMFGGVGNDTYRVDNLADVVSEAGGNGIDTVFSSISFSFANPARVIAAVENLTLVNVAAALAGTGNNLANTITGNNFNNRLTGGIGNDVLRGSNGSDVLTGGPGIDRLTGGAQGDTFVFNAPLNVAHRDTITDFSNAAGNNDTIRLQNAVMTQLGGPGMLAANKFFAGATAHDADDRIIYNKANGAVTYDSNGNAAGGSTLLAIVSNKPTLTVADFVVI